MAKNHPAAKNILEEIKSNMGSFSKGQKLISKYILDNYDKAAFMTAKKLGEKTKVSESTVVRFAIQLGYDGYPSMQKALQEMIRSRLTSIQRIQAADDQYSGQHLAKAVMQSDMDKLRRTIDNLDQNALDQVINKLMNARHIYILGVRSSTFIAGYLNYYLQRLFSNVTLVHSNAAGEIFEQLFRIQKGDVILAISFPRYSKVTLNTVRFAIDRGCDLIAITDTELSPLYAMADVSLLAHSEMLSFVDSMVAPMSLINALIVSLGSRMDHDLSSTFAELETIWDHYGVFGEAADE